LYPYRQQCLAPGRSILRARLQQHESFDGSHAEGALPS
jgi:hypothetical protein